jgi:hypothetical protein
MLCFSFLIGYTKKPWNFFNKVGSLTECWSFIFIYFNITEYTVEVIIPLVVVSESMYPIQSCYRMKSMMNWWFSADSGIRFLSYISLTCITWLQIIRVFSFANLDRLVCAGRMKKKVLGFFNVLKISQIGCLLNSVCFFHFWHSLCHTEKSKIPRKYVEFCVVEFAIIPRNYAKFWLCNLDFSKRYAKLLDFLKLQIITRSMLWSCIIFMQLRVKISMRLKPLPYSNFLVIEIVVNVDRNFCSVWHF